MIDADLVEQFQRDGAVCVRQLFAPGEIATLAPVNRRLFPCYGTRSHE
jgi:hypothetical protein